MTTFKIGDKVRASTHAREAVAGSPPQQPGDIGTVCEIGPYNPSMLRVRHDDGSEPWYRADDLIEIREVARAAGEETELERRVAKLEGRHNGLREAMAAELHGFEQRLDRLEGGEEGAPDAAETIRLQHKRIRELEQWIENLERTLNRLADEMGARGLWKAAVNRAIELRNQHDAITCRLRAIVPWDDAPSERNETAEELLDAVEGPAKLVLRLIDAFTPEQLAAVAAGIKAIAGEGDHISPATLVADLLEHLAGESS